MTKIQPGKGQSCKDCAFRKTCRSQKPDDAKVECDSPDQDFCPQPQPGQKR